MGFQMELIVIRAAAVLCGEIICLMMLIPRMRKLLVLRRSMLFDVPDREQSRQIPSGNAGTSTTKSEEEKVSANKRVARAQAKVPFEKGYSQMDWLKLTQKHHDLAGVDILLKALGKDCTSLFNNYHAWVNAEFLLEKCLVGTSDASQ